MSRIKSEFKALFDYFPNEIILIIFDYLSSSDIIYAFFNLNQRLNNLLLYNQRYLELPAIYSNTWERIFSKIGSQIECLHIKTINFSFPLRYFSNLKSLIISTSFGCPNEELELIVESEQFNNFHSFILKENEIYSDLLYHHDPGDQPDILKIVFNPKNSLKIFEYSNIIPSIKNTIEKNYNLHSLTLVLTDIEDIWTLVSYTPNLKYLNIQVCARIYISWRKELTKVVNSNLKQFYLTIKESANSLHLSIYINMLFYFIELIASSSLTCFSLNLASFYVQEIEHFPIYSNKLQYLLESMTELKQFHLYIRAEGLKLNSELILSKYQTQFWFDHNWFFGTHGDYFYTLPFHFDYLHGVDSDFNNVKCSNPEILITNPRLWYNIKFIQISSKKLNFDSNFIKELKIKMPKLNFLKFGQTDYKQMNNENMIDINQDERSTLDNVKTIACQKTLLQYGKEWLINVFPNVTHLILYNTISSSLDKELIEILNKNIQQLDIFTYDELKQFVEMRYGYFSNVQYINYHMIYNDDEDQSGLKSRAVIVQKILMEFKNLKTLLLYIYGSEGSFTYFGMNTKFKRLISYLNRKEIEKNYQIKCYHRYLLFSKQEYINDGILKSIWKKLSIFHSKKMTLK